MADPAARQSALADRLPWALADGLIELSEIAFAEQILLRCRMRAALPYVAGLPMPLQPNRVEARGPVRVLWLAPDEWLVVAPQGTASDLTDRLHRALANHHAVLFDQSASRAIIAISGAKARSLLEKGCGIDLHPRAFGPGHCAQTVFAKVPVIIDQVSSAPSYRLLVRRSYAAWLCDWLIDAAAEFSAVA